MPLRSGFTFTRVLRLTEQVRSDGRRTGAGARVQRLTNRIPLLEELDRVMSRSGRHALRLTTAASVALAVLEMAALALLAPLLALATDSPVPGSLGPLAGWIDRAGRDKALAVLALAVLVVFLVKGVLRALVSWWTAGWLAREEVALMSKLVEAIVFAPYEWHLANSSSSYLRTTYSSVDSVVNRILYPFTIIAAEVTLTIGVTIVLLVVSPLAVLAGGGYLILLIALVRWSATSRARQQGLRNERYTKGVFAALQETFAGLKVLRIYRVEEAFISRLREQEGHCAEGKSRLRYYTELPRIILETGLVVGVIGLGAVLIAAQGTEEALPVIAMLGIGGFRLLPSLARLASAQVNMRGGRAALESVDKMLREVVPDRTNAGAFSLDWIGGDVYVGGGVPAIRLDRVAYSYPGSDRVALEDICFDVAPGEQLAIVGPSGAGKSTLVDVLLGILRPPVGSVSFRYPGGAITDRPLAAAYVPQEGVLIDATVAENVRFGRPPDDDPAEEERRVLRAIGAAHLSDVVRAMPEGTSTVIGERGVRMSGGQRQRLALARALYGSPDVLVLDEATSALDTASEERVARAIHELRGRVTVVTIAHRLSTVRDADRLVLLEGGKVVAIGGFGELASASVDFARNLELAGVELS
jgi:ABC-type multidrug transport system fused ATPase/permease subunit